MKADFVGLAALMALATYPWRAIPLLAPGVDRLPRRVLAYLRLVGPAMLAALAAESVMVVLDADRHPSFHVGPEWLAVAICVAIVWRWRNLLAGLVVAAVLIAVLRAAGIATLP
jgi:branched-subunit amino acid transport protein